MTMTICFRKKTFYRYIKTDLKTNNKKSKTKKYYKIYK